MTKTDIRMGTSEPYVKASLAMVPVELDAHRTSRVADALALEAIAPTSCDEALIHDDRNNLSPAQAVENRLSRLLRESSYSVSHLQTRTLLRRSR